jgi:hypothetical protein
MVTLQFEWVGTIPGTVVKAEVNDNGDGWWQTFLTNTETGRFSGVHSMHLPGIQLTHEQAARIAMEIWIAKGMDT